MVTFALHCESAPQEHNVSEDGLDSCVIFTNCNEMGYTAAAEMDKIDNMEIKIVINA